MNLGNLIATRFALNSDNTQQHCNFQRRLKTIRVIVKNTTKLHCLKIQTILFMKIGDKD